MFERQDSNSKINVLVTMDNHVAQVVPTCTKYDNIPTLVFDDLPAYSSPKSIEMVGSAKGDRVNNNFVSTAPASTYRSDAIFQNGGKESLFSYNSPTEGATSLTSTSETEMHQLMDLNTALDPRLMDVARQALVNGNMTPLIKEELKCSIQSKRLKEGKHELKVEFTEPPPDELTPEEVERVEKRKVQNRLAARRFRDKQKSRAEYLQKKCDQMETEHSLLMHELAQVKMERDQLKQAWRDHLTTCPWQHSVPSFIQITQPNNNT